MRERIEISAVRDRDLRAVLEKYGLAEKIDRGEQTCSSCSDILTWENIGAFIVLSEGLELFCSLSECLEAAKRRKKND